MVMMVVMVMIVMMILIFLQCIRTHDIRVDDLTKTE